MQLLHHLYIHKSRKTDPYKIFNYFFESWHTQDQYKRHQCCKSSCRGNVWNLLYKCKKYSQLTHHFDEYKLQIHMTTQTTYVYITTQIPLRMRHLSIKQQLEQMTMSFWAIFILVYHILRCFLCEQTHVLTAIL